MRPWAFVLTLAVVTGCQLSTQQPIAHIGQAQVQVEVANTPELRERGLSYRESLPDNQGMLFIFDEPQEVSFWMHGMQFPLDIIWIADSQVIGIERNVPTPTSTELLHYRPNQPVEYVLEVNADWARAHDISIGDSFELTE